MTPRTTARSTAGPATASLFSHRDGVLHCDGVSLQGLAARFGTPAFIYAQRGIEHSYRNLDRALAAAKGPPHRICYAVKANSNLSILRLLARLGSSFDIVSGGELFRLREIGVAGQRLVFSGVGKTREEIREALRFGILLFHAESEEEAHLLEEEAARARTPVRAGLRVTPDVMAGAHPHMATGHRLHKFGIEWQVAKRIYLQFARSHWLRWQGISMHLGSQILSMAPYRRGVRRLARFARELQSAGIGLRYMDVGGGVGIRYWKEQPFSLVPFARLLKSAAAPLSCEVLLEPGRLLVGASAVLLTRVICVKEKQGKRFVVVDAAINDFLRPALYGAVHPITPVRRAARQARKRPADVVGPVCETGDFLALNWPLPEVATGDLLALWGAGAYGFVASSNYNSRPRAAEVLVLRGRARLIRRREKRRDLIRGE